MTDQVQQRPRKIRARHAFMSMAALPLFAAACTPGLPTAASSLAGQLTSRTVTLSVSGTSNSYSATSAQGTPTASASGFTLEYNGSSAVIAVHGSLGYDPGTLPPAAPVPTLTLNLQAGLGGMTGSAVVVDPNAGVATTVNGLASAFTADDHGNVAGSITEGTVTISFSTQSVILPPGTDAALETLLATQADFCADAQQRLAGLNPSEVPIASITNTVESPRAAFAGSKTTLSPLTTRTWTDTTDVTSESGDLVTISNHISCKTRSADHVATTGVSTAGSDAACSTLNQRSIDLALGQMTPSQQAGVHIPTLGADIVRQTGVDWTTPIPAAVEFDGTTLRSHALLVAWTDPAYAIFPDTIRGVHYCTVWSPAYAYHRLLDTLP